MKTILSIGLLLLAATGYSQDAKKTCAVLPFENMTEISPGIAKMISERVFAEIGKTARYQMIERAQVERVLKENQLSLVFSDESAGIEAGRVLKADYVVMGSVGQMGRLITINCRFVNVESGAVIGQAVRDHEGRVEDLLRVAEFAARQLLGDISAGTMTGIPTTSTTPPPATGTREEEESFQSARQDYTAMAITTNQWKSDQPVTPTPAPAPAPEQTANAAPTEGQPLSLDLGDGTTLDLVWVPAGSFMMGAGGRDRGRSIMISRGFWMSRYEITNQQYKRFTQTGGYDGSRDAGGKHLLHVKKNRPYAADMYPVIWVSWINATVFCNWLTGQAHSQGWLPANCRARLPTDAEWEYACRAGTTTFFHTGDRASDLNTAGWWRGNVNRKTEGPQPVGQKAPNAWGLHDMHGNAAEWVQDWWDRKYFEREPSVDPSGPPPSRHRVIRGGSWKMKEDPCRSGFREQQSPNVPDDFIGFRIVIACDK